MVVFEFVVGLSFLFLAALCSMQGLSSLTRDQTCAPASGAWSPHHCTSSPFPSLKGKPPWKWLHQNIGFPWGLRQYRTSCSVGDLGVIPGLGSSTGEGNYFTRQTDSPQNLSLNLSGGPCPDCAAFSLQSCFLDASVVGWG